MKLFTNIFENRSVKIGKYLVRLVWFGLCMIILFQLRLCIFKQKVMNLIVIVMFFDFGFYDFWIFNRHFDRIKMTLWFYELLLLLDYLIKKKTRFQLCSFFSLSNKWIRIGIFFRYSQLDSPIALALSKKNSINWSTQ